MVLQIPESEREYTAAFVSAPPALLDALVRVIPGCKPNLLHRGFASELSRKLGDIPGASESRLRSIVRTLFAMYSVLRGREDMSPEDAAADAVGAIQEAKIAAPPDGWDAFRRRLAQLLSDDAVLGLSAKAVGVTTETQRHVHGFRVYTDARPIFGEDPTDGPKAFAIMHTLQVNYWEDGEELEWFVTLDGDDLESLQGVAERGLAKERSLKAKLEELKTPVLSWKVSEDGK
jgi:hypothetical protein